MTTLLIGLLRHVVRRVDELSSWCRLIGHTPEWADGVVWCRQCGRWLGGDR